MATTFTKVVLSGSTDGKQIKVAQVREVLKIVPFPPIEARYRVVIVEPADLVFRQRARELER